MVNWITFVSGWLSECSYTLARARAYPLNYGVSDPRDGKGGDWECKKERTIITNAWIRKTVSSFHANDYYKTVPKCNWTVQSRAIVVVFAFVAAIAVIVVEALPLLWHSITFYSTVVLMVAMRIWMPPCVCMCALQCRSNVFLCMAFRKQHDMCVDHLQFCKSACNATMATTTTTTAMVMVVAADFDSLYARSVQNNVLWYSYTHTHTRANISTEIVLHIWLESESERKHTTIQTNTNTET